MKLTNEQKVKLNYYVSEFKHYSGIEDYNEKHLIELIENAKFEMPDSKNPNVQMTGRVNMMKEFSRIYKDEMKNVVIPSASKQYKSQENSGIKEVNYAFDYMMSNILDSILPEHVKNAVNDLNPEYGGFMGLSEEEYDKFIDEAFESQKNLFVGEAWYKGEYANDLEEKKKNAGRKYDTREEERKADPDYRSVDGLLHDLKLTKELRDNMKDFAEGKTSPSPAYIIKDKETAWQAFGTEMNVVANKYMLVREKYNHLNIFQKWLTPKGLELGGAMRETRRVFNEINAIAEKTFGEKITENVSGMLHTYAQDIKDEIGETKFSKVKEEFHRQSIEVSKNQIDETEEVDLEKFDDGVPDEPENEIQYDKDEFAIN